MYRTPIAYNPSARLKMALKSQKRKRSSIVLGITATLLASLSFTFMSACARMLEPMASGEMTFLPGPFWTSFHSAPVTGEWGTVLYGKIQGVPFPPGPFWQYSPLFLFPFYRGAHPGRCADPVPAGCLFYVSHGPFISFRKASAPGYPGVGGHCSRNSAGCANLELQLL